MNLRFPKFRFLVFFMAVFYSASTLLFADTVSGKIETVKTFPDGRTEIVLKSSEGKKTLLLTPQTAVESSITANKIKKGSKIFISESKKRSGGRKGFKSPFAGIPKGMRKSMGLPNIPSTPDIPGQPDIPEVPQAPKIPKGPNVKGQAGEPAAANAQEPQAEGGKGGGGGRAKTQPPEHTLTDEEKSLYGKADSGKSLLKGDGSQPEESSAPAGRRVLKAETTKEGVNLELEGEGGQKEKVTLSPNKIVVQEILLSELRKNMNVRAEVVQSNKKNVVQKIQVVG